MKDNLSIKSILIRVLVLFILLFSMFLLPCFAQTKAQKEAMQDLLDKKQQAASSNAMRAVFDCPKAGVAITRSKIHSNRLKNRDTAQWNNDKNKVLEIHIDSFLKIGYDTGRFSDSTKVRIIGAWVMSFKLQQAESCNCYNPNLETRDIHINLANNNLERNDENTMVVELTRYTRNPTQDTNSLFAMQGKQVVVEGYLFFDNEHLGTALNTKLQTTKLQNVTRRTAWEVHPVISIVPLANPKKKK